MRRCAFTAESTDHFTPPSDLRGTPGVLASATFVRGTRVITVVDLADDAPDAPVDGVPMELGAHYRTSLPLPERLRVARRALLYPVRRGRGPELAGVLGAGTAPGVPARLASALVSSTIVYHGDVVARYLEATATVEEELAALRRIVPTSGLGAKLNTLLDTDLDLTTPEGFDAFYVGHAMSLVHAGASTPA